MTILLLGANGQLGRSFIEDGGLASRDNLVAACRDGRRFDDGPAETVDMASPESLRSLLDRVQPRMIVNAAAYTAVDKAEQEETLATRVNGAAVAELGRWAAAHGALVVHYSTDYVFDGSASSPYPVNAPTAPLGAYGRSKLAGEQALTASGAAHLTFRTAWVYAPHGHNFLRTMLRVGAERDELRVVADQIGAPTPTSVIVAGTLAALGTWNAADAARRITLTGIHHLVASGHTSWHGFAEAIFDASLTHGLLPRAPTVTAITSTEYPTPARRPAWSVLDNTGFEPMFGYALPDWHTALDDVIPVLFSKDP
ncbi:dTDP-4-dehydrorhamnose reductase [Dyella sp. A6]|uniref:dTDP-4-dehydrorhamnose reductase n=1 Tax=Dyella aluminiiresistens TaxID=3069105 RepID=UPI002E76A810|nr:dTDP-4-dehydrorhamnose reductase [Dyella sp. A6]